jgi:hypothetical protein
MTNLDVTITTHAMSSAQASAWRQLWDLLLSEDDDASPVLSRAAGEASGTIHPREGREVNLDCLTLDAS